MNLKTLLEHTFQNPIFTSARPLQHKQLLCKRAQPLCGLLDLKTPTGNQFSEPHVQQGSPPTTQTTTLWAHTTTVWVNGPQNTTGTHLTELHIHQGQTPTIQTTTLDAHTTTLWAIEPQNTTVNQFS